VLLPRGLELAMATVPAPMIASWFERSLAILERDLAAIVKKNGRCYCAAKSVD
jgi:hypothetical protein